MKTTCYPLMVNLAMTKTDLGLILGLLGLLAAIGLSAPVLLAAVVSFAVGRVTG